MFKSVYFGLLISSSLLGAVGLVQIGHTEGWQKKIAAVVGIGGATAALTSLGLGIVYNTKQTQLEREFKGKLAENGRLKDNEMSKAQTVFNEVLRTTTTAKDKLFSEAQQKHNGEINGLKLQINELQSRIKVLEFDKTSNYTQIAELQHTLNLKTEEYFKIILEKDLKIKSLETVVNERDTRIEDFLTESKAKTVVFFAKRYDQLDSLQKTLSNGLESDKVSVENKELFVIRIDDIRKLKGELTDAIEEIKRKDITDFNTVLTYIFKFDNKFFNAKLNWKNVQVNDYKEAAKELEVQLKESIPKVEALARFRSASAETDERITALYQEKLENNHNILNQLVEIMDSKDIVIEQLTAQVTDLTTQMEELKKPLQAMGTHQYALVANRVSSFYYEQLGYRLDFIQWAETETGYSITYATRQNNALTNDELLPGNAKEQLAKLTGCLQGTFPEFTCDYRNCTVILVVTLRKPVKKETSKADIDKKWVPVEKFEKFVKNWERVRITAGSTGGKSPTAKNLALAIMKTRKGQGEIRLYDPQDGSKKDYWDIPKSGTTHADNVTGMGDLCKLLDERSKSKGNHPFVLYIFDEVDSTIAQERENNGYYYFRDKVTYSLKQASHQNIGAIYIGQSADANEIPGMTHSAWGSAVGLHIGSNAGIAINALKTLTSEQKTALLEKYATIQEYCDKKNEELDLDVSTDPGAYRFALAVPLTGLPQFIQLPDFDTYDYYEVMGDDEASEVTITPTPTTVAENLINEIAPTIICPTCASDKIKRNGSYKKNKKVIQRYKCTNCGESFNDEEIIS